MISAQRKITSSHLERLAVVYLRQSTPAQVRVNVRSTERQYAIADEASRLGWESGRIVVIDGDLGVSGRDAHARESYKELVARVCPGGGRRDLRTGGLQVGAQQRGPPATA